MEINKWNLIVDKIISRTFFHCISTLFFFSFFYLALIILFNPISEISLLYFGIERKKMGQYSSTIIPYTLLLITRTSYSVSMPCNFPAISGKTVSKSRSRANILKLVKGENDFFPRSNPYISIRGRYELFTKDS